MDLENEISEYLLLAKKIEEQYLNYGGVDVRDTLYMFIPEVPLEKDLVILKNQIPNLLPKNPELNSKINNQKLYYSDGSSIDSKNQKFLKKSFVASSFPLDNLELRLINNLSYIAFDKIYPFNLEEKSKEEAFIYLAILEGAVLTNGKGCCLSLGVSYTLQDYIDFYSCPKNVNKIQNQFNETKNTKNTTLETYCLNMDFLRIVGINFIKYIPHKDLNELIKKIKHNFPTIEELLAPERYLEKFGR